MSKGDVINFMQTYQRNTENMFKKMHKYTSIILNLNNKNLNYLSDQVKEITNS